MYSFFPIPITISISLHPKRPVFIQPPLSLPSSTASFYPTSALSPCLLYAPTAIFFFYISPFSSEFHVITSCNHLRSHQTSEFQQLYFFTKYPGNRFHIIQKENMFTNEEFGKFMGVLRVEPNMVEIECKCTLRRYGDSYGKLRIFTDGKLEIDCCCYPGCPKVNLSPVEFGRHLRKNTNMDNWRNHLWVMDTEGNRVRLAKTTLLRYHTQNFQRPQRRPYVHRDEFISCSKCNRERRFSLRTKELCRIYHDAFLKQEWQCSDMPQNQLTCDEAEERKSRKPCRGCPKKFRCKGCIRCVCVGCSMCRFEDCHCQICSEFIQNKQN